MLRKTGATEAHEYERQHHEGELYGYRILARLVTAAVLFVIGARARALHENPVRFRPPSPSHLKADNNFPNEHLPRARRPTTLPSNHLLVAFTFFARTLSSHYLTSTKFIQLLIKRSEKVKCENGFTCQTL